jgi:dihydroorotate dehydrogenase
MPTLLLRGSLVRPHLEAILGLSRAHGRSDIRRRKQSSSTSSTSSPSPHPSETAAQTQARTTPTHPEPHIVQQVTGQAKPQARIEDPIPGPNTVGPLPFWQRLGPLTRAGQAYARAQRARPWATQVASALVVYLAADFGAQQMGGSGGVVVGEEEGAQVNERRHDWGRTVRSLAIGGMAAIPGYIW